LQSHQWVDRCVNLASAGSCMQAGTRAQRGPSWPRDCAGMPAAAGCAQPGLPILTSVIINSSMCTAKSITPRLELGTSAFGEQRAIHCATRPRSSTGRVGWIDSARYSHRSVFPRMAAAIVCVSSNKLEGTESWKDWVKVSSESLRTFDASSTWSAFRMSVEVSEPSYWTRS
jgi:hypothetical protein